LKTGDNLDELLNQIYNRVNPNINGKYLLSMNLVAKYIGNERLSEINKNALSLILLGAEMSGKSSFLNRYFKNLFNEPNFTTIGIDKEIKILKIMDHYCKLTIWDTAGQARFRALPRKYYNNVDGILILFNINDNYSLEDVSDWMKEIKENTVKDNLIYIIGNKIDKNEENISKSEIQKYAKKFRCKYYEISCKWNLNIEEVIARMILECYQRQLNTHDIKIEKILDEDFLEYAKYKNTIFPKLEKYIDF